MNSASQEIEKAINVADIARDLVLMWDHQKIKGLPRSERNAAIDDIRKRLTDAVHEWEDLREAPV